MESSEQDIITRILKDANEEAELIVKNAKTSAELLLEKQRQSGRNDAQKQANTLLKRAQNEAQIIRGKTNSDIQRQASWSVLSEKNRLIQKVIDTVSNQLVDLKNTPKYVLFLEKLTVESGSVLGGGNLTPHLSEDDSKIRLNLSKLAKEITKKTGTKTKLSLSNEHILTPGVLVKKVEDNIFVDNSFESILKRQQKQLKLKIAKILFAPIDT